MQKILIATHNAGKLREFASMFARTPFELVSLSDVGIDVMSTRRAPPTRRNATLKAVTYAKLSGLPTLADDSGLEVDGLDGEPGCGRRVTPVTTPPTTTALHSCCKS